MKIAFFISGLDQPFGKQLVKTMELHAKERKVELHVFAAFGLQDNNLLHAEGEKSILYLADLEQYQCIMVAGDTMARYDMHDELMGHLARNAKCPILGIRYEEDGCYNLLVENHSSLYEMTQHFIYDHHYKDICFVTGRIETKDAQERLAGYRDAMDEAGIRVSDDMIFEGDYWRNKGPQIVDYFMSARDGKLPEVIICSNDYMALSVCDEVIRRGYHVPDDICVSGFDDLDEAQLYVPALTSIAVDFNKMAVEALNMAISLANGNAIPHISRCQAQMKLRGTCGCNLHEVEYNKGFYHRQMRFLQDITKQVVYMQSDFNSASTEEECFEHLQNFLKDEGIETYYVCLKKQNVSQDELDRYFDSYIGKTPLERAEAVSKHERMINLRMIVDKKNGVKYENILFDKHEILPPEYVECLKERLSIIAPIHSLNETYGYIIFQMSDDMDAIPNERYELLCMFFGDTLRRIYMHQNLLSVRDAMTLYLVDPLTKIYNRRGFERNFVKLTDWAKKENYNYALVSLDLDRLKEINDNFGHKAGDLAICGVASSLTSSLREEEICARIGGDEFVAVLLLDESDRIERFRQNFECCIAEINSAVEEDYIVEASIGVFVVNEQLTIAEYLHEADILMYENKRKKKMNQKRNI